MDLDICIVNGRHWTSKNDNKVYNTLDYIITTKENFVDSDNFKGYQIVTSWLDKNIIKDIKPLECYKATFETRMQGLKSTLILRKLTDKSGNIIDLS